MVAGAQYQPDDKIGGRYHVHQVLLGGMGEVYLCLDLEKNRPYALKTFQREHAKINLSEAFEREVATWVALEKHANIVRCFYLDFIDKRPFMLLEWVAGHASRGTELRSWLQHGALPPRIALDFAIDICRGLAHAQHKQPGIVHRDLKPDNVLIDQSRIAKITDFGLAKVVQSAGLELDLAEGQPVHGTTTSGGTPLYMAPEQWVNGELDERTDIYAVGGILFEMLMGHPVFVSNNIMTLFQQHHEEPVPELGAIKGFEATPVLDALLQKCLAKERKERFDSVQALLSELERVYQSEIGRSPRAEIAVEEFTAADYSNRGRTYHALRRYEDALADYQQAIDSDATMPGLFSGRGNTYHALERYDEALSDYDNAIRRHPDDAMALHDRAVTYLALRQYDAVLADCTRAIRLDNKFASAYYTVRGQAYAALGRYSEALSDYREAIRLDRSNVSAYRWRGIAHRIIGGYDQALADFNAVIALDPRDALIYASRGLLYSLREQYQEALNDFSSALKLDPHFSPAYSNRGDAYAALAQHEAAIADYSEALRRNPDSLHACLSRALSYKALGRHDEAIADLKQALRNKPSDAGLHYELGMLLYEQGKLREALHYLEKTVLPGNSDLKTLVAEIKGKLESDAPASQQELWQQAFDAFQQTRFPAELKNIVAAYPFMTQRDFIAAVEEHIPKNVPPKHRAAFEKRLSLLKQLAEG